MNHATSRELILSIVQTADFDYIAPFNTSLQRTGYRGRLVIFASAMKGDASARLEELGVTVIPYRFVGKHLREIFFWPGWPLWRQIFRIKFPAALKERLAHIALPLFYRRHLIYLQFLRAHRHEFDRVFLTDARDVYFQADPFAWPLAPGLHFFLLDAAHTVTTSGLHQHWLTNQFGRQDVAAHRGKNVSCAGTTLGDTAGIISYLEQMLAYSLTARRLRKITSDDQGVHNFLIHENLLPQIHLHANWRGPVLTTTPPMSLSAMRLNDAGQVVDETGAVIPVLHQYDRLPDLNQHLRLQ